MTVTKVGDAEYHFDERGEDKDVLYFHYKVLCGGLNKIAVTCDRCDSNNPWAVFNGIFISKA